MLLHICNALSHEEGFVGRQSVGNRVSSFDQQLYREINFAAPIQFVKPGTNFIGRQLVGNRALV